MTLTQDIQKDVIFPESNLLSDEPPMESELHLRQLMLLIQSLELLWKDRPDFYAFGNLTVYYSPNQLKSEYFRGPDFFVVLGVERKPRTSWVVWEEDGKYPHVIVEILSKSTADTDRGLKKEIYQEIFRTPNYFWFDPKTMEFKGFELIRGKYEEITPNEQGWLWSEQLGLYLGVYQSQLRFFNPQGQLVPTLEESSERDRKRAEQEKQRAEQEKQRADRLTQKLLDLGVDLSEIE
ncbi:MAG: Uma2 family endonuclease [Microcystaceae cyanobacterium]